MRPWLIVSFSGDTAKKDARETAGRPHEASNALREFLEHANARALEMARLRLLRFDVVALSVARSAHHSCHER